ncbi:MAG: hypothetical protein IT247_05820 [Bacteroidia bacterium]|nr:hypothetical protein [Bacteroidia bacterium]
MKKLKYLLFYVVLILLASCKGYIPSKIKTVYYNWSPQNLTVRLYRESILAQEEIILIGSSFEERAESPPTTPYFVAVADSMIVMFADGKKLVYTDFSSPTKTNPLSYYGYNHFQSNNVHNFLYAFTDEHYSKAQ